MDLSQIITLIIFIGCYALALSRKIKLAYISLASALLLIILGVISAGKAAEFVNLDVLGIYWGFMMVSMAFAYSKMPLWITEKLVGKIHQEKYIIVALCILTALLSGAMENVGVVLMMAPVALEVAKKLKANPFYFLVPIALSANIVTTLTMVADPPSIILAMKTGMGFFDFYWFQNHLSIGTVTFFGVIASMLTLLMIFRNRRQEIEMHGEKFQVNIFPTIVFVLGVLCLGFLPDYGVRPFYIALITGLMSILIYARRAKDMFREFDWNSFFFVIGIFIVVGSLESTGLLKEFSALIANTGISNPVIMTVFITIVSLLASSVVDNVPWTILMIPVCTEIAALLGINPYPLLFGMLIGTGMGGNITPVGATANVFACGILEKNGVKINLKEYLKISVPFTISAVVVSIFMLIVFWF